jgi:hypothetical protein
MRKYILNFEYLSRNMTVLDIETEATEDQIDKIIVWDNVKCELIKFETLSIDDQEAIMETIWERVVLEIQADEKERERVRLGFHKIWNEATEKGYIEWLNRGSH